MFGACMATQYKQQDVCRNDAIFQLRKISWKCGSIWTNTSLLAFHLVCVWVERIPPTHQNCHVEDTFLRNVNCRSATPEIHRLLWNLKVHTEPNQPIYTTHPRTTSRYPAHAHPSSLCNIHCNSRLRVKRLRLRSCSFFSGYLTTRPNYKETVFAIVF
jgi:hypothetical protein